MITLGGIDLGLNFALEGVESAIGMAYTQKRSLEGSSTLISTPLSGGRVLTLGTATDRGVQGIWCQKTIMEVKALESGNTSVPLSYYGSNFNVKIVDTSNFTPLFYNQPPSDSKQFTGSITLIEV